MELEVTGLPIVSAIIERAIDGVPEVLLQTRWKPERDPQYSGLLEVPAGVVRAYESVHDALRREVFEETGLTVSCIVGSLATPEAGPEACIFFPFCCQQQLRGGKPWVGFVFICEVDGGVIHPQEDEVRDVHWVSRERLATMLSSNPAMFFPLQREALSHYVSFRH